MSAKSATRRSARRNHTSDAVLYTSDEKLGKGHRAQVVLFAR
jgi:hypothetical protein